MSITFAEIMKEQELESIQNIHKEYHAYDDDPDFVYSEDIFFEENLNYLDMYLDEVKDIQHEEDEKLALILQNMERERFRTSNPKVKDMTQMEKKMYYLKMGVDVLKIDEDFQRYYEAIEPRVNGDDENFFVFDDAQKEEDKEIGYYPKSHPSKRTNSIPTPLHHKIIKTRQGKNNNKKKKKNSINGSTHVKSGKQLPTQEGEEQGYAMVFQLVGARVCRLYSYTTGKLNFNGYLLKNNNYATKGSLVLYKERSYQKNKVDILHVYTENERQQIIESGAIITVDMTKVLPITLIEMKIIPYLLLSEALSMRSVSNNWMNTLNAIVYKIRTLIYIPTSEKEKI